MAKPFFLSKTMIVNIVSGLISIISLILDLNLFGLNPEILMFILTVLNVFLRAITNTPIEDVSKTIQDVKDKINKRIEQ